MNATMVNCGASRRYSGSSSGPSRRWRPTWLSGELVELVGTPLAPAAADDALLMYFFVCVGLVVCAAGW